MDVKTENKLASQKATLDPTDTPWLTLSKTSILNGEQAAVQPGDSF
jgi:hypothetical protein